MTLLSTQRLTTQLPTSFRPGSWCDGSKEDHLSLRASYQLQYQTSYIEKMANTSPTRPFHIQSPRLSLDQLPCWLLKRERRKGNHRGGLGTKRWALQDPSSPSFLMGGGWIAVQRGQTLREDCLAMLKPTSLNCTSYTSWGPDPWRLPLCTRGYVPT